MTQDWQILMALRLLPESPILTPKAEKRQELTISVPKTKNQHICKKPKVSETTEDDIKNLQAAEAFKHICEKCDRPFKPRKVYLYINALV